MSDPSTSPAPARRARELLAWPASVRRTINLVFPLVLASMMIFVAFPRDGVPEVLREPRKRLGERMGKISLSQSWNMYAPDPSKGHVFMELLAHDRDGTVRKLEDSHDAEHGWGTVWAWKRTRMDIWRYAVARRAKPSRNRTWYLRGVCVREARKGHEVARLELFRVFRRIRPPDRVAAGADLLGPRKRSKPSAAEGSCNVKIIREMIATDPMRGGQDGGPR